MVRAVLEPKPRSFLAVLACLPLFSCGVPEEGVIRLPIASIVTAVDTASPVIVPADSDYRVNVGDQLDIKFPYKPDFDQTETVRPDGKISVVLLGSVAAAGRTPETIAATLKTGYQTILADVPPPGRRVYQIQAGDTLDVKFNDNATLNDQALVLPDGRINLALVGSVVAEGRSPEQLSRQLTQLYGKYTTAPEVVVIVRSVSNPQFISQGRVGRAAIQGLDTVAVVVRSYPPPRLYIGGEVLRPGEVPYAGPTTLLQAVVSAGGPTQAGELRSVVVLRRGQADDPMAFVVNLDNQTQGAAASDIPLHAFDVVFVPKTKIAKIGDFLDQYLYRLVPALRNSSVGFSYVISNQHLLQ